MRSVIWGMRMSALALLVSTVVALGQATNSGDIRGVVTDASGALVPGVTVTVTNVNTGITKVLTTNRDGLYDTSSIVAGTYSVSFEKEGFKKFQRASITLEVGISTVNAKLEVGAVSENVVVTTDIPLLDTETGEQKTTLDAKSMDELPNVAGAGGGPSWENFTILLPGATGAAGAAQGQTNPGQEISANGNLPYSNVLADGASNSLSHSQNADVNTFETVAELQVSTSSFSAQYGIGGIIFNQISKGGTNQFHGAAYDYYQSDEFNSSQYQLGSKLRNPPLHFNNFGASIGGPVLLPHVNHKAFFYFNYDQIVNHGGASIHYNDIPTTAVMGGDFSGQQTLYDPTTQTFATDAAGNTYPVRKTFLSEYGCNCVPQALWDKVAANFQKFYPTPDNHIPTGNFIAGNVDNKGITRHNFVSTLNSSAPFRKYFGRFDYDISPNNRLTLSVEQRDTPQLYQSQMAFCPVNCQTGDVDSMNPQVTDVWTISARTINEFRFGYTRQMNFFNDLALGKGYAAQLGWQFAKADTIPAIQFTNNYPYAWIQPQSNSVYKEHVFDPSDVVTMIRGKHVLHFGGEMLIYDDNSTAWGNTNAGTFQFSGQYTQHWTVDATSGKASPDNTTGADYADFLLGLAQSWNASVSQEFGARLKSPQFFVQDDWKVRPNLTLNLGVRYQIRRGWSEVHGNESTWDQSVANPAGGPSGAMWYGTTKANGRTQLENNKYNTILPRAGFSWQMDRNTTVRGGFGYYAYNLSLDTYGSGMGGLLAASGNYADTTNGQVAAVKLGGSGTKLADGTPLPYSAASTAPDRFNGASSKVHFQTYDTPNPGIWQWNLGMQRALGSNTAFDMAYVGSHGRNLAFNTNLNQIPVADMQFTTNAKNYRPNPNVAQINGNTNNGISNYHSMQVQLNRRMSHGLSFGFNYTWSHFLDSMDSSGWGSRNGPTPRQYQDVANNYSNSNFDVRNAFKGMAVYQLPFGKGRALLNNNWLMDEIFGGYEVSSTMQFRSGNPFNVTATDAKTYANASSTDQPFPNYTGLPLTPPHGHSQLLWYNPAAFSRPADGTFGNVRRNSLYGPGLELVNLSASKRFEIREAVKLQVRVDATNAFNHVSLGQPNGGLSGASAGQAYSPSLFGDGQNGDPLPSITGAQYSGRTLQGVLRLEF